MQFHSNEKYFISQNLRNLNLCVIFLPGLLFCFSLPLRRLTALNVSTHFLRVSYENNIPLRWAFEYLLTSLFSTSEKKELTLGIKFEDDKLLMAKREKRLPIDSVLTARQ